MNDRAIFVGRCPRRQLEGALSAIERHIGNTINIRFERTVQMGAWTDPSSTVRSPSVRALTVSVVNAEIKGDVFFSAWNYRTNRGFPPLPPPFFHFFGLLG